MDVGEIFTGSVRADHAKTLGSVVGTHYFEVINPNADLRRIFRMPLQ